MASPQRRPPARRPPGRPAPRATGPDHAIVPSFGEWLALLSPFAGALVGWWLGDRFGGIWFGLLGGLLGTGVGAVVARRGAPEILP